MESRKRLVDTVGGDGGKVGYTKLSTSLIRPMTLATEHFLEVLVSFHVGQEKRLGSIFFNGRCTVSMGSTMPS